MRWRWSPHFRSWQHPACWALCLEASPRERTSGMGSEEHHLLVVSGNKPRPDYCRLGYSCRCVHEQRGRESDTAGVLRKLRPSPRDEETLRWIINVSPFRSTLAATPSERQKRCFSPCNSFLVGWRLKKAGYTSLADRYHRCRETLRLSQTTGACLSGVWQTDRPGCCGYMGPFLIRINLTAMESVGRSLLPAVCVNLAW